MYNKIVILGASGLAKEVYEWMLSADKLNDDVMFFDNINVDKVSFYNKKVIHHLEGTETGYYVLAVGEVKPKRILQKLASEYLKPKSVIHFSSLICSSSRIGTGVVVCPGVVVTADCIIGDFVTLNLNVTVGHDTIIGEFSTVSPGANISGNVTIGKNCYIGTGAVIREKITVGDNAVVGAGAVVVKDVPPNIMVVGNPAKRLGRK